MKKGIGITIAIVTFIGGVLLGNQYGRRDVANSRPPQVEGQFSQESTNAPMVLSQTQAAEEQISEAVSIAAEAGILSKPLFLFTDSGFVIYGAVSMSERNGVTEAVVNVWKMPSGLSDVQASGDFVLGLYDQNDEETVELKTFKLANDTSALVEVSGISAKAGQYFGIRAADSDTPLLMSEDIR